MWCILAYFWAHVPISSAVSGVCEHLGSWASPRFNSSIFQALCQPIGYRYSGLSCGVRQASGRAISFVEFHCRPALD